MTYVLTNRGHIPLIRNVIISNDKTITVQFNGGLPDQVHTEEQLEANGMTLECMYNELIKLMNHKDDDLSEWLRKVDQKERKLTDWKFMVKYRICNVEYDEPAITVTFSGDKQVRFTHYTDSEIYELFTKYLTPDAILFQ